MLPGVFLATDLASRTLGAMEAGIFGLLGLLLGFAFAGAMSQLDTRRQLIVREANAIGTAYLRLDMLPEHDQPELRRLFHEYLEARFHAYEGGADLKKVDRYLAQSTEIRQNIWARAIVADHLDQALNKTRQSLQAINEMIDVTTARTVADRTHLPWLVFTLLFVVALLTALTAGYAMAKRKRRSLLHDILYAAAVAATVYVVPDLGNPHVGFIRLDATDKILHDLHDSIR